MLFNKVFDKKIEEAKEQANEAAFIVRPYFFTALLMLGAFYAGKASALETVLSNHRIEL